MSKQNHKKINKRKENSLYLINMYNITIQKKRLMPFVCIPSIFKTNISHLPFDYKITFLNSQH